MDDPVTIEWRRYRLRLREPLELARGDPLLSREGVLVRATFANGRTGWGDAAPFPGWSRESVSDVCDALASRPIRALPPSLAFALDSAARAWGPGPDVRLAALVEHGAEPRAEALAGASSVKVKVSGEIPAAVARVRALAARLAPGVRIRLDANRAWSFGEAVDCARALGDLPIEYFEEPTRELEALRGWHAGAGVPLALDETLLECGAEFASVADVFVVKPTLLGGWDACAGLASRGRPVVISACLESGVGIHALARLAGHIGGPPAGLDTHRLLAEDLVDGLPVEGFLFRGGMVPIVRWERAVA